MCVKVIASQRWDVVFRHGVVTGRRPQGIRRYFDYSGTTLGFFCPAGAIRCTYEAMSVRELGVGSHHFTELQNSNAP